MKTTGRTLTLSATLLAGILAPTAASEAQAGWAHQRKITIDTTAQGAHVSGDVKGFPLPVRLDATNFDFAQAKPGGADLRFDDAAGRPLSYEIEKWDAAAKQAAIWVRADVRGNATQTVTLKWGNPEASSESDGAKVFPRADGWITAHHLDEKGAANGYRDSAATSTARASTSPATRPAPASSATR
ncbi:DUF2341 domain-containing protein [Lentzea sp. JNUCC 0626]|uniref:DUF2341 domain-containing protein n=1 Tax=Lentzea sp. JNUCC 0626 TaxID=3367513 RepID=UPI00374A5361